MQENIVHSLYKFIKEGVTNDQMFAATKEAFCEREITEETMLQENAEMESNQTFMLNHVNEVAPEGWEGTVKSMKKSKKISNPWALAWYMKGKGYKAHKADEGKLPANIANIQKPDEYIQDLKEEKKDPIDTATNPEIKTDNAGVTEEPEETKVSKEMGKETPGVDKLVQDKDGKDPSVDAGAPKAKEEKKIEPEVDGVKKEKTENEGKLPANIGNIQKPAEYIQNLAEDSAEKIIADGISEEAVARDLASRKNGEAVMNPDTRLWSVISKVAPKGQATATAATPAGHAIESKIEECPTIKVAAKAAVPDVKAAKGDDADKLKNEATVKEETTTEPKGKAKEGVPGVDAAKTNAADKLVKEDVEITVKSDTKEVNIVASEGGTQVTTMDVGTPAPLATVEPAVEPAVEPMLEPMPTEEEEPEMSDEEALEMAEKLMVAEHLEKLEKLTEKQACFLKDVKAKKMSKKNQAKVDSKKKELK
jgi:hypothetical protein